MKYCKYCNINVSGTDKACPLCQSPLQGMETDNFFPKTARLRKSSVFYKIVLFIILAAIAVLLIIDFLTLRAPHKHFSVPIIVFILAVFWLVRTVFIKHRAIPQTLFMLMIIYAIVIDYTGWYFGFHDVSTNIVIPCMVCAILILNFVGSFIDREFAENGLVYILMNVVAGIVPYIALYVSKGYPPVAWIVCMISSVLTFLALIVFRGKSVFSELHKRLHI